MAGRRADITMFFGKPSYRHVGDARHPRVLALYSDEFIGEIRIKPYLNALMMRGIIADYFAVGRDMKPTGSQTPYPFTHIWCQRNMSTAQYRFLRSHMNAPIVYDLDDLLTSVPEIVMKTRRRTLDRMTWCLEHAAFITVATERLREGLREDAGALSSDPIVLKNGCASADAPDRPPARRQVVWTSSDLPFFLRDHPAFIDGVAQLVDRNDYELILIGRFDDTFEDRFDRCRRIRHLDFVSYRQFLRSLAGALALAPLPSQLPRHAQRYFDAKSDIKLVDYLSSGLVPIYSRAPPYAESDLFLPELAAGDADEMLQRLRACIENHARMIDYVHESIHAPGLLRTREYPELSKALDCVFA